MKFMCCCLGNSCHFWKRNISASASNQNLCSICEDDMMSNVVTTGSGQTRTVQKGCRVDDCSMLLTEEIRVR